VIAGLFWLAAFFAGTQALDRSFTGEQVEGCWLALLMYPVSPGIIFLAKLTTNFIAICLVDAVLATAFAIISGVPLFAHTGPFLLIIVLANLGFAALGTVLGALTAGLQHRSGMLVLLLLPIVCPVILAAAQATRLLVTDAPSGWQRCAQLLACFAATFVSLGTLLFEYVAED
jgi:heme exporter protein B